MSDRRRALLLEVSEEMANEIKAENWTVWYEKVTAGENSATNEVACTAYIKTLLTHESPEVLVIRRVASESPSPAANEYGTVRSPQIPTSGASGEFVAKRYRNGSWGTSSYATNYDAVVSPGTVYEVVGITTSW